VRESWFAGFDVLFYPFLLLTPGREVSIGIRFFVFDTGCWYLDLATWRGRFFTDPDRSADGTGLSFFFLRFLSPVRLSTIAHTQALVLALGPPDATFLAVFQEFSRPDIFRARAQTVLSHIDSFDFVTDVIPKSFKGRFWFARVFFLTTNVHWMRRLPPLDILITL